MEATITLGQAIGFVITLLSCVIGAWVNLSSRVRTLEVRQDQDDRNFSDIKQDIYEIKKMLLEVKIELAKHEKN